MTNLSAVLNPKGQPVQNEMTTLLAVQVQNASLFKRSVELTDHQTIAPLIRAIRSSQALEAIVLITTFT